MPLTKSTGQMYPWVTHQHNPLGGECPHKCSYCSVDHIPFGRPDKYKGEPRLVEKEMATRYGKGKTIFMCSCHDLFAWKVSTHYINRVRAHCMEWPDNAYVFQTKNPARYIDFTWRPQDILGVTIETNRDMPDVSEAPTPRERMHAMMATPIGTRLFVTIEPVLDFDVDELGAWIADINPEFLNLGADSKGHALPEPTAEKINQLVEKLWEYGIELREKHNLQRLVKL